MRVSIVCGSQRSGQSAFLMNYLKEVCINAEISEVNTINLFERKIKFWDEEVWSKGKDWDTNWNAISEELSNSQGIIILAPEYGGMVPPILKNFFLLCSQNELAHKPALLVGVSSGINGAYPIMELRGSSYKNNKICFMPDHLIIREVEDFISNPESEKFIRINERIKYSINMLKIYTEAFNQIRSNAEVFLPKFKYGM